MSAYPKNGHKGDEPPDDSFGGRNGERIASRMQKLARRRNVSLVTRTRAAVFDRSIAILRAFSGTSPASCGLVTTLRNVTQCRRPYAHPAPWIARVALNDSEESSAATSDAEGRPTQAPGGTESRRHARRIRHAGLVAILRIAARPSIPEGIALQCLSAGRGLCPLLALSTGMARKV